MATKYQKRINIIPLDSTFLYLGEALSDTVAQFLGISCEWAMKSALSQPAFSSVRTNGMECNKAVTTYTKCCFMST